MPGPRPLTHTSAIRPTTGHAKRIARTSRPLIEHQSADCRCGNRSSDPSRRLSLATLRRFPARLRLAESPDRRHVVAVNDERFANDRWTLVTFTFERVNPVGQGDSTARVYIDGELAGDVHAPLHVEWMNPGAPATRRDAVVFLGVDYVGGVDDLRIYKRAVSPSVIRLLSAQAD